MGIKKYRLTKIGRVGENDSFFGDTSEYFDGFMFEQPTIGERFTLYRYKGGFAPIINTSPITKIEEGVLTTLYSVYRIEEL